MNIAIYARVSSDQQAEQGYSLAAQVEDCKRKAEELGAGIVKEYIDDGYSGAYLERPALDSLREALRQKMFAAVICWDVDRLSRNLSHQLLLTDEIEASGAALHFVKANYEASPEGRLFYAIRGAFAGYEREKIRERSMRGKLAMMKQGKIVQDSNVYGYDFDKTTHAYVVNAGEAANVREIYRLYLSGIGGVRAVCLHLNQHLDKYPPPNGRGWVVSTVRDILAREMYTGTYYAHRVQHVKTGARKEKKSIRPRSEWVEMSCPAIISKEMHLEAAALLSKNKRIDHHRQHHNPPLLQGIIYCRDCGQMLKVKNGGEKRTRYYMCWENTAAGISRPGCGARSMQCEIVDNAFWELLENICRNPAKLKAYMESTAPTITAPHDEAKRREAAMQKIKTERAAIMSWFSQQLLTHEEATARLEALRAEENRLMIDNITPPPKTAQPAPSAVCEAVSTCIESSTARRRVVMQVIDRVIIKRLDKGKGRSNYALDMKIVFKK